MKNKIIADGYPQMLTQHISVVGEPGIPELRNTSYQEIPLDIIPFEKCRHQKNKRVYVHFYMHDKYFDAVLTNPEKYVSLLQQFDGIITPDCTLLVGQSKCLQETNTYFNRAVGVFYQKQGMNVIPTVRWSDESSFSFCFLGVQKKSIVSVSTHGCISSQKEKELFKNGLAAMLDELEPKDVLVHGRMPDSIFKDFKEKTVFHNYPSHIEKVHKKAGDK